VEELDSTVKLPEQGREALCNNQIDKDALSATIEQLGRSYSSLDNELSSAQANLGILQGADGTALKERGMEECMAWLRAARQPAQDRLGCLRAEL